jgi:desulfoferrodoxin (superoxide reductase-like protein)
MNIAAFALTILVSQTTQMDQTAEIGPDFVKLKGTQADPKHTPKMEAPKQVTAGEWFPVKITVGKDALHPSLHHHHVRWIALLADGVELTRVYLHPTMAKPEVTFVIALPDDRTFDKDGNVKSRKDRKVTLRAVEAPTHTSEWWVEAPITVKAKK